MSSSAPQPSPLAARRPGVLPGTRASRAGRRALPAALALAAAGVVAPAAHAVPSGAPVKVAGGLKTPWELALAPDGRTFVTERDGGIRVLGPDDALRPGEVLARSALQEALPSGEVRKILGLALAPDFATSRVAYVYVGTNVDPDGGGPANGTNGIWRLREQPTGGFAVEGRVFDGIPSDGNHDGGRMVFGPDRHLYVTTGDIHQPARPQDRQSLNGKILRFSVPGSGALGAPADNPFAAEGGDARYVWSLGHRHPQGLAFDAAGRLWESEHGPTGELHGPEYPGGNAQRGRDELNLVVRGANYGWPLVSGPMTGPGLTPPAAVAGDGPWAPGGLAVGADGSLYAPFLAGKSLHRFDVRSGAVVAQADHFRELGRQRVAVARGQDLLLAQDGGDAGIYRVPLGPRVPGGSDAADPPAGAAPPVPGVPGTPAAGGSDAAAQAKRMRSRSRALALRLRSRVRALGRARLQAGRTVSVRLAGPSKGRTRIELRLRSSRGPLLARSTTSTRSTAATRYRVRLGPTGRSRLRATSGRVVVVRLTHRPSTGEAFTTTFSTRLARRR